MAASPDTAASRRSDLLLRPEELRRRCDPAGLPFHTTADVEPAEGVPGQARAVRAIDFAVQVPQRGYNVYAAGPDGTGKQDTVEARLRAHAAERPSAPDVAFLFNFDDPARPLCASLPPGRARRLARAMTEFVERAGREIPHAFESESYQRRRTEAVAPFEQEHEETLTQVRSFARSRGLDLEMTPAGLVTVPLSHGRPVTPKEFEQLPEDERRRFAAAGHEIEQRMAGVIPQLREIDERARERIRSLDRDVVLWAVGHLIDDVKRDHGDVDTVADWLERVREDVIDNYGGFLAAAEPQQQQIPPALSAMLGRGNTAFRTRYEVNAFVAREDGGGAPVVIERNPTFPRLFGRIEFETTLGAAVTDHTHIKSGAIHKASGGYLVLRAADVLRQPFAWDKLKDTLRAGQAQVENLGEQFTLFPTATLTPDPVAVDVKVVLVGSAELYELMHALDEDMRDLFRVKADFDVQMSWDGEEAASYAAFISARVAREGLCHFDAGAVARVVEDGARRAADQGKLSTRFSEISDVVVEASHWARSAGVELVSAEHVELALRERRSRSDLFEQRLAEMVDEGTLRIEVNGSAVGQVNGLAVSEVGDYAFGHPTRITATTATGGGEFVSIDRESKLTGRIHDKGFLTMRGYLEERYGSEIPLSLSASLTFEQSYAGIEGDSASTSELCALLSSLADAPIAQGVALTGSVDQHGRIQAVGGVTEKVEGFFSVCRRAGLTGTQGVIIPATNRRHLMLDDEVIAAVSDGTFRVWAIESADEAIEILTGVAAGERGVDGAYPAGTVHRRVQDRLEAMARVAREWGQGAASDGRAVAADGGANGHATDGGPEGSGAEDADGDPATGESGGSG